MDRSSDQTGHALYRTEFALRGDTDFTLTGEIGRLG